MSCCLAALQLIHCVAKILSSTEYPCKWDAGPSRFLGEMWCFTPAGEEMGTKHSRDTLSLEEYCFSRLFPLKDCVIIDCVERNSTAVAGSVPLCEDRSPKDTIRLAYFLSATSVVKIKRPLIAYCSCRLPKFFHFCLKADSIQPKISGFFFSIAIR